MQKSGSFQRRFSRGIARVLASVLTGARLEKLLRLGCGSPFIRKWLKLGRLAYAYTANLQGSPSRMARLSGYDLYVHLRETWGIRSYFFRESGAFPIVGKLLSPGDTFVDAGANIGQFSAFAAFSVGSGGHVFSFEPDPNNRTLLEKTVTQNKWGDRVTISPNALWKEGGQILKFFPSQNPENSGTASLINHGVYQAREKFIEVKTLTLDQFFKDQNLGSCRLLKIDVERAEHELLTGFYTHLQQQAVDHILIEMESNSPARKLLEQCGYEGYRMDDLKKPLALDSIPSEEVNDFLFSSSKGRVDLQQF